MENRQSATVNQMLLPNFFSIPSTLLAEIYSFCSFSEIIFSFFRVSRSWYEIRKSKTIWLNRKVTFYSISTLKKYVEKKIDFPLTNIVLAQKDNDPCDFKYVRQFKSLQSIELHLDFTQMTLKSCDELKDLPVTSLYCLGIEIKLPQLLKQFPSLTRLGLVVEGVMDSEFVELKNFEGYSSLTDLDIDLPLSYEDFLDLQEGTKTFLPNLQILNITGIETLNFEDVVSCFPPSLRVLRLSQWKHNDGIDIGKLVHLKKLEEISCEKIFSFIFGLEQLTLLKKLSLSYTRLKNYDLSSLIRLEELELEYVDIENGIACFLSHLQKNVKTFSIKGPYNTSFSCFSFGPDYLSSLIHFEGLHTLKFHDCLLPSKFGSYLQQLTALKHLKFCNCSNIGSSQLMILDGMLLESFYLHNIDPLLLPPVEFPCFPVLLRLYFDLTLINDQWIENLPVFPKVQRLGIPNSQITNKSLKSLSNRFPSLTALNVSDCSEITELQDYLFPNLMYLKHNTKIKTAFIYPNIG